MNKRIKVKFHSKNLHRRINPQTCADLRPKIFPDVY